MKARRALGEFAVIVLGVLTALLAESFMTDVREASEADSYRARLAADLAADVQNLRQITAFYARSQDSGAKVMAWIDSEPNGIGLADLLAHVFNAASRHPIVISRDTWDDLVSTGKVALLEENERISLSSFYRISELYIADLGQIPDGYRMAVWGLLPADRAGVLWEQCTLYDSLASELPPCEAASEWDPGPALSELRRVPGLRQDLSRAMNGVRIQAALVNVLADMAEAAAEELPRQGSP